MKCEKSENHTISYQSLLLSTTVLNDNIYIYLDSYIYIDLWYIQETQCGVLQAISTAHTSLT